MDVPDIVIVRDKPVTLAVLRELVARFFEDMVKLVVDVERGVAAIGGELHAAAEAALLQDGSRQADLWGANYYPGLGPEDWMRPCALACARSRSG